LNSSGFSGRRGSGEGFFLMDGFWRGILEIKDLTACVTGFLEDMTDT